MEDRPTHGRRASQAYRAAGRSITVSPLARYLQLLQSVGFWSSLLFVILYVFDLGLFLSPTPSPLSSPTPTDLPDLKGAPDDVSGQPLAGEVLEFPPAPPLLGFLEEADVGQAAAGVASFTCFGKPCLAEEYEYVVRAYAGIAQADPQAAPAVQGPGAPPNFQDPRAARADSGVFYPPNYVPKGPEAIPADRDTSQLADAESQDAKAASDEKNQWGLPPNKYTSASAYDDSEAAPAKQDSWTGPVDNGPSDLTNEVPDSLEVAAAELPHKQEETENEDGLDKLLAEKAITRTVAMRATGKGEKDVDITRWEDSIPLKSGDIEFLLPGKVNTGKGKGRKERPSKPTVDVETQDDERPRPERANESSSGGRERSGIHGGDDSGRGWDDRQGVSWHAARRT